MLELCKVRIAMNNIKLFPQPHHCTVNWKIIKLLLTFNNYAPTSFMVTWNFSAFFIRSVKLTFWTVIHPMLHNGEHSCLCAWADGSAPPSGDSEHREPAYTSPWGTHPMVRCLILWSRGVRGTHAETWWALTLGLGMGHRLSRRKAQNTLWSLTCQGLKHIQEGSLTFCTVWLTLWNGIIRECFCP